MTDLPRPTRTYNRDIAGTKNFLAQTERRDGTAWIRVYRIVDGGTKLGAEVDFREAVSGGAKRIAARLCREWEGLAPIKYSNKQEG